MAFNQQRLLTHTQREGSRDTPRPRRSTCGGGTAARCPWQSWAGRPRSRPPTVLRPRAPRAPPACAAFAPAPSAAAAAAAAPPTAVAVAGSIPAPTAGSGPPAGNCQFSPSYIYKTITGSLIGALCRQITLFGHNLLPIYRPFISK